MILKINGTEVAGGLLEPIEELNSKMDTVGYWLNPVHWVEAAWDGIEALMTAAETGYFLMAGTVIGLIVIMLGADFPKKWIFWSWVVYWTLKGLVFI